jgi:hypothetical protein
MAIRENLIQARSLYVGVSPNVAPAASNLGVDGSIGIGTPTPNERLHIVGNTGTRIRISSSDNYHIGNLGWEDTRVFLSAAGYGSPALGFDTAGSERMRITNGGNVGIGTTIPGRKLTVYDTTDVTNGQLRLGYNDDYYWDLGRDATVNGRFMFVNRQGGGSASELVSILPSGNVGIGTTSPAAKLQVDGNILGNNNGSNVFSINSAGANYGFILNNSANTFSLGYGPSLSTVGTSVLTWNSSGNVGIGTTNPAYKLDVVDSGRFGSSAKTIIGSDGSYSGYGAIGFGGTENGYNRIFGYDGSSDGIYIAATYNKGIQFWTDGTQTRMIIRYDGYVGIGTTNPGTKLEVAGPLGGTVGVGGSTLRLVNTDTGNAASITAGITGLTNDGMQFSTDGTVRMIVASGGNVGIGTTSPGYKLDVNGAGRFIFRNNSNEITDLLLSTESANSKSKLSFLWYGNETAAVKFLRGGNSTGSSMEFWTQEEFGSTTQRMTITSAGNVGIGETSPSAKLHIAGSGGSFAPLLKIVGSASDTFNWPSSTMYANLTSGENVIHLFGKIENTNNSAYVGYKHVSDGSASNMLTLGLFAADNLVNILASGNVGIGTTNPLGKLHTILPAYTNEDTDSQQAIFGSGVNGNGVRIGYSESGNSGYINSLKPGVAWSQMNIGGNNIILNTIGSERMRITTGGNVGIGTSSPAAKLHVVSPDLGFTTGNTSYNALFYNYTGNSSYLEVKDVRTSNGSDWTSVGKRLQMRVDSTYMGYMQFNGNSNNYGISFGVGGISTDPGNVSEAIRITSAGNVGIGTTNPYSKLDVSGTVITTSTLNSTAGSYAIDHPGINTWKIGVTSTNSSTFHIGNDTGGSFASKLLSVTATGNVGIGTTAPAAKLEVYGTGSTSSTANFLARNGVGTKIIESFDDGFIRLNNTLNINQAIYINIGNSNVHYALDSHIFSVVNDSYQRTDFVTIKGNLGKPAMGVGTMSPDNSAILDLTSRSKGFLPPRMTYSDMMAIASPAAGLVVYDVTNNKLTVYAGSGWVPLH